MTLCTVAGSVTSTIKHPSLAGRKLLLCYAVNPDTAAVSTKPIVAVDTVQAGIGDTVLVIDEGNAARKILGDSTLPIRTVVAAIVDAVDTGEAQGSVSSRVADSAGAMARTATRGATPKKETGRGKRQ